MEVFSFGVYFSVSVKIDEVILSYDGSSERLDGDDPTFYCHPMLRDVLDPLAIALEVDWYADERLVQHEEFALAAKSVGVLEAGNWHRGEKVGLLLEIA